MKPAAAIRDLVFQTVRQLGCESATVLGETILIRDGKYAGRRFEFFDGFEALWLIDADRIDFHAASGELLRSLVVENDDAQQRSA